jgi:hypothetical protein
MLLDQALSPDLGARLLPFPAYPGDLPFVEKKAMLTMLRSCKGNCSVLRAGTLNQGW